MKITYSEPQREKAIEDALEVYRIAEERMVASAIPCSLVQLRNAFQVFRYAWREWAADKDRGVVLRAFMVADERAREVRSDSTELMIQCEDAEMGIALEILLRGYGYEEESIHDSQE